MYLSVIIPAYNEEKRIGKTLESVRAYLTKQSYDWEVIVVNDGSSDDVTRYTLHDPHYKLINNTINQGKAKVVRQGMLAATGDLRLFMDADNATTIENIEKMLPFIPEYQIVIASIGVPGAQKIGHEPFYRRLLGKAGNLWIQLWATPGIHDTQRGFKLFTREAVENIFPKMRTFGWGFDVEILALARKLGYKIKEVPITWNNDPNSKVNMWAYPKVLLQTVVIWWDIITNKYGI